MSDRIYRECTVCSKRAHFKCGICKIPYCGSKCQRGDWAKHKKECKPIPDVDTIVEDVNLFNSVFGGPIITKDKKYNIPLYKNRKMLFFPHISPPIPKNVFDIYSETMKDFVKQGNFESPEQFEKAVGTRYLIIASDYFPVMRSLTKEQHLEAIEFFINRKINK